MNMLAPQADSPLELTPHGLRIHRTLTWEEWSEAVECLRDVHDAYLCMLGDLTRYGREQFGDERVAACFEQLELNLSDAKRADAISYVPLDLRGAHQLTSEQAYVLAVKFPDDAAKQEKWARLCQKHKLNGASLKASIEAGKIITREDVERESGSGPGIPTVQNVRFHFDRWRSALGDREQVLSRPRRDREQILETLKPIIEFAHELADSLDS